MLCTPYRRRRTQEQVPGLTVVGHQCSIVFLCYQGQAGDKPRWLDKKPPARNLRTGLLLLEIQDCLLAEEDHQLPFAGHVAGVLKHLYGVEDLPAFTLMGS